jgi:hypothetical protein
VIAEDLFDASLRHRRGFGPGRGLSGPEEAHCDEEDERTTPPQGPSMVTPN